MIFTLPSGFASRLDDLDLFLREEAAAVKQEEKDRLLRLALVTACQMLSSIDDSVLDAALTQQLREPGSEIREEAARVLAEGRAFQFFLDRIEDGLLEALGVSERARQRMTKALANMRPQAVAQLSTMQARRVVWDFRDLRGEVCAMKDTAIAEAEALERSRLRNQAHTYTVNTLGAATVAINTAAAFAAATSILALPAISVAATVASAALGAVAQSWKPS